MPLGLPKGVAGMEIIRSVETIRGKIRITFESSWQVWLRRNEDPGFPLTEGTAVDRESFLAYIRIHQYPPALDRAVRMLAERSCSRREIERKLTLARFDPDVTDLVLFKLEKENLLNDREFAMQWVHSRSRKYGASRIRQELRTKGIDEDIASEILEDLSEEDQLRQAVALAVKKIRSLQPSCEEKKWKQRITSFLVRRGYSWDLALKAFEEAMRQIG